MRKSLNDHQRSGTSSTGTKKSSEELRTGARQSWATVSPGGGAPRLPAVEAIRQQANHVKCQELHDKVNQKNRKAAREDNVFPEVLRTWLTPLISKLRELFRSIWKRDKPKQLGTSILPTRSHERQWNRLHKLQVYWSEWRRRIDVLCTTQSSCGRKDSTWKDRMPETALAKILYYAEDWNIDTNYNN